MPLDQAAQIALLAAKTLFATASIALLPGFLLTAILFDWKKMGKSDLVVHSIFLSLATSAFAIMMAIQAFGQPFNEQTTLVVIGAASATLFAIAAALKKI